MVIRLGIARVTLEGITNASPLLIIKSETSVHLSGDVVQKPPIDKQEDKSDTVTDQADTGIEEAIITPSVIKITVETFNQPHLLYTNILYSLLFKFVKQCSFLSKTGILS
jgi:hypothetical protein